MFILIILAALTVTGLVLAKRADSFSLSEGLFGITGIFAGVMLAIALVFLPIQRMDTMANLAGFRAIEQSREGGTAIEAAAWRMKVAEANAWLASTQYWNGTPFDLWIPDAVESVEPIK